MRVISPDLVKDKKVLLRMDIDVPIKDGVVVDDFRLEMGVPTLHLCLQFAKEVVVMGHIGRPGGREVIELSVEPIYDWFQARGFNQELETRKLKILENLRFEPGEEAADIEYAKSLAAMGDFYVNEAFASHHSAASTTVLPKLLLHAAGLRFTKEVDVLQKARSNPQKPQITLIGGAKIEDKYAAIVALSKVSDKVLVGGLLPEKIRQQNFKVADNVVLATTSESGVDISHQSTEEFIEIIQDAKQVIWGGPMGKYEEASGNIANQRLAQAIVSCGADSIIGGGDTLAALAKYLPQFGFVSTGGGAMLELLANGTLPTIEVLK